MEFKDLYKTRRVSSLAGSLAKRCQNVIAERHEKRREFFWGSLVIPDASPNSKSQPQGKTKNPRAEMLKKWKAEKMKKLEEAKKKRKPVFKVGVVQRKVTGSPIFTHQESHQKNNNTVKQTNTKLQRKEAEIKGQGVLTRARGRNLGVKPKQFTEPKPEKKFDNKFCKIEKSKRKQINSHVFKVPDVVSKLPHNNLTFPCSPKLSKRKKSAILEEICTGGFNMKPEKDVEKPQKENIKIVDEAEAKPSVKTPERSPLRTPEKPKTEMDDFRPIYYSPFVTVRSGKKSGRRSKKKLAMDVEEQIKKEENEFKCRIFSFRKYVECETKRLLEICDKWKHIYEEFEEVPADVEGDIDSAIGKTKLLTSDKFLQFKGLIDKCENGDPFIKIDDLQGFQDWVSIEVEKIDEEFHKLEKKKCNNWASETVHVKVQKVKVSKNPRNKPIGKSNIRSHILAARKLLKEGNVNGNEQSEVSEIMLKEKMKTATTPRKNSSFLLKEVLNSEAKKKNESSAKSPVVKVRRNSGLEIMIATQKIKYPTPAKLQKSPLPSDYEIYVGKEETPSKSILKKTPKSLISSSKARVTFDKKFIENDIRNSGRGLNEKYFQPLTDDESSPQRVILGDLGNLTPGGILTRSRSRQLSFSFSGLASPLVK